MKIETLDKPAILKIPKDLEVDLKVVAAREGRDPDELVEEAVKAYLLNQYLKNHR